MLKYSLLFLSLLLYGCEVNTIQQDKGMGIINVKDIIVSEKLLEFDYEVQNTFAHPIWICEDVCEDFEIRAEVKVTPNNLLIRLKSFDVPKEVLLYAPILAKYVRLDPNELYVGSLSLGLPISSKTPLGSDDKNENKAAKIVKNFVFEMGYFDENLYLETSECIEKTDSDRVVYVGHLWEKRGNEHVLKVVVDDVNIPCVF